MDHAFNGHSDANANRSVNTWSALSIRTFLMLVASTIASPGVVWADEQADYFHRKVEPILRQHCYACHSHAMGQMENGLALDWKSGWVNGGDRGPAIVPGKPEESLLILAVEHRDADLKMPDEKLDAAEIDVLVQWVRQGAFDDRAVAPSVKDDELWWSLRPLVAPTIPGGSGLTDRPADHAIDAFIGAKLDSAGLSPSPETTPRELIRRLYFDLIGLPPSPDEVARFESNPSEDAYLQLVDRLLASERYGERWARHWFDTIHFADSHGYEHDVGRDHAWPYRDYVIDALNHDLPWSTFIRQQLAVDHFEPESKHLTAALGFLGAGTFDYSTYSTGPVTFDYLDRDDMLTQTMAAFVSTTANCARCHAHKFDPVPQEDYYALQAVFSGIVKGDIRYDADAKVAAQRHRLTAMLDAANRGDSTALESELSQQLVATWISQRGSGADWQQVDMQSFISSEGATLSREPDGTIVASGPSPETDTYVLTVTSSLPRITALRLDLLPHDSLPMKGPGRCQNGNLHLSEVVVTAFLPGEKSGKVVAISQATADFNQANWGVHRAIDGDVKTAWGIHPAVGQPHNAVFEFTQPLDLPDGSSLTVTLKQLHGGSHLIGAFRLSVTGSPAAQTIALPQDVEQALNVEPSARSSAQNLIIASHVVRLAAELELSQLPQQAMVYAAASSVAIPLGSGKSQPASIAAPKIVHLLQRGDIDKPKNEVAPGALSTLQHLPSRFTDAVTQSESVRRAALADWLAHPDNVLTWRSAVNRIWHYHFGRGLCDTPNDFGRMGGLPSHPELIDWLAVWFRDDAAGSLKKLHRLIVTSKTYRQSSEGRSDCVEIDSDNRLLWRQNHQRLDADSYRDFVLAASGRIDFTVGGPAIQHFHQSPGAQLTPKLDYAVYDWSSPGSGRRSIYRYVWRGIPDPLMSALDFPDLGLLTPTRSNSISPLQALALFNNNFVLFHSQAMAQQIIEQTSDIDQQVVQAAERVFQRPLSTAEQNQFRDYVNQHGLAAYCRLLLNSSEFLFVP